MRHVAEAGDRLGIQEEKKINSQVIILGTVN